MYSKIIPLLFVMWITAGCALISDPEKSGAEIIAVPEGPWCDFRLSPDGNWLNYIGDYYPVEADRKYERETVFVDLTTGQSYRAEPDDEVLGMIGEGFGPDGNACFSPDSRKAYISAGRWLEREEAPAVEAPAGSTEGQVLMHTGRRTSINRFEIDLTSLPLQIRRTDTINCAEQDPPEEPDIRIEQVRDNLIRVYNGDGRRIAEHKPRGMINGGISMVELSRSSWDRYYAVSPDRRMLAYTVFEGSALGFSAPTHGYLTDLQNGNPLFLGASVYSIAWNQHGHLYGCTSHRSYKRVIARWTP